VCILRRKVLLIEDDLLDQAAWGRLIKNEKLPYDYLIVDSVEKARGMLGNNSFDVIIVDYALKDGTGLDLIEIIKDIPLIFITGVGNEGIALQAMRAGVYDYLIKDLERNYLKLLPDLIEKAINNKREKEQLSILSQAMMAIKESVFITDLNGKIQFVNKAFCQQYGYSSTEIIGADSKMLWEKEMLAEHDSGEFNHQRKDGTLFPALFSRSVVYDNSGKKVALVSVSHDDTEQREVDQAKSEFISVVSHEIRTPLTVIMALAQLLLNKEKLKVEKIRHYFSTIYEESRRLTDLVNDFLDIQRMESGEHAFKKEMIAIEEVLEEVKTFYQTDPKIKIKIEKDRKNYSAIVADFAKIKQLLTNLISNAIKYSASEKKIKIKVRVQETPGYLRITVEDKGLGIPQEAIPNLFTKFYRVDNSDHRKVGGTGLGLAICKEIVTAHQGEIGVTSQLGEGSQFFFKLPKMTKLPG